MYPYDGGIEGEVTTYHLEVELEDRAPNIFTTCRD